MNHTDNIPTATNTSVSSSHSPSLPLTPSHSPSLPLTPTKDSPFTIHNSPLTIHNSLFPIPYLVYNPNTSSSRFEHTGQKGA